MRVYESNGFAMMSATPYPYIALFSHFIPCSVWEAVYILDGLLNNESEIQPDTIHGLIEGVRWLIIC